MTQHQKIIFRLEQDEDGYPPVRHESIWVVPLPNGSMRIDSIPFYVMGISSGDEVIVESENGEYWFLSVTKKSNNSTFRLIPSDISSLEKIRADVKKIGGETECDYQAGLIAVEIPAATPIHPFLNYIVNAKKNRLLDFEEAALRHFL